MKTEYSIPYHVSARTAEFSYSSLMRLKARNRQGQTLIGKPGQKKIEPFDFQALNSDMDNLYHGKKRTSGVGTIYHRHRGAISRRELQDLINKARDEQNLLRRADIQHIHWHHPGIAYSLDDTEYYLNTMKEKLMINNIQDLSSQHKFTPICGSSLPCGEEIAGHLDYLCRKHGPPLFLKRDNGKNLNHFAVNQVLEEYQIIGFNSPNYYPQYNGAIEHTQGEVKNWLSKHFPDREKIGELELCVEITAHELNHIPRRKLNSLNSCQAFFGPTRIKYSKKQRKETFLWIENLALEIQEKGGNSVLPKDAWRIAITNWLQKNQQITVTKNGRVLPTFQ